MTFAIVRIRILNGTTVVRIDSAKFNTILDVFEVRKSRIQYVAAKILRRTFQCKIMLPYANNGSYDSTHRISFLRKHRKNTPENLANVDIKWGIGMKFLVDLSSLIHPDEKIWRLVPCGQQVNVREWISCRSNSLKGTFVFLLNIYSKWRTTPSEESLYLLGRNLRMNFFF